MFKRFHMGIAAVAVAGCGLLLASGCETTKFDRSTHGTEAAIDAQAGQYWKKDGWWSLKNKTGRVMITEFSVEFITETETDLDQNQLGLLTVLDVAGIGDSKREYEEQFKQTFPGDLYRQFVAALEAEGYTVIPMDQLTGHPEFGNIAGAAPGAKTGNIGPGWNQLAGERSAKYQIYPTPGLPVVDDSWFRAGSNNQAEIKAATSLNADLALRVRIRCGVSDDGHAVLAQGSTIRVMGDFKSGQTGLGTNYWADTWGTVVSKHGFEGDESVASKGEFRAFDGDIYDVEETRFGQLIMDMFPTYARMGIVVMKK